MQIPRAGGDYAALDSSQSPGERERVGSRASAVCAKTVVGPVRSQEEEAELWDVHKSNKTIKLDVGKGGEGQLNGFRKSLTNKLWVSDCTTENRSDRPNSCSIEW